MAGTLIDGERRCPACGFGMHKPSQIRAFGRRHFAAAPVVSVTTGMSVVLVYHDVAPRTQFEGNGRPGPLAAPYKLEPQQFEAHLDAIERTNRAVGVVRSDRDAPAVALSFDDGGRSSTSIADALERRGWRGHFFIVTSLLGTPGFLEAEEVRDLDRRGHVIGSHTHTHPDRMAILADEAIESEWVRSRAVLTEVLGRAPTQAAVPGGDISRAVIGGAGHAGYEVLMTSEPVRGIRRVGSLLVFGRFPIRHATRPSTAAHYATGRVDARLRLALAWKTKRLAKRVSPHGYDALRRLRVGQH